MFEIDVRVEYIDTDAMGVVHHASYLRYFERTRVAFLRELNLNYSTLEREGLMLPVRSAELSYIKPLKFDDLVKVKVSLKEKTLTTLKLHYQVHKGEVLTTEGSTTHVLCRKVTGPEGKTQLKAQRIPDEWIGLMEKWQKQKNSKL